jgi:NADPH:quinone reductase-like Zn-dependent oxidoreductase
MKAVRVLQTGNIDDIKIEDIPVDTMHSDELLVKVNYCGINPVDWKCIEHGGFHLPYTIGSDVSGIVEKTGSSVQKFKKGDAVLGSLEWAKQGAFAEYVITKEEYIVSKTAMLSFREAAALPLAGLTAWQGLFDKLQLQKGEKILIQAGAGGVGLFRQEYRIFKIDGSRPSA